MPLTAYEKFNVEAGKEVIIKGKVGFNCLNHMYKPKPTDTEPDPKERTTVELIEPVFYGDKPLAQALFSKEYSAKGSNDQNKDRISLVNKGNFLPTLFDVNNEQKSADELIPEGKKLADGQLVLVHARSFAGQNNNIGCSFDSLKFMVPFDQVKFENVGVTADVFDDLQPIDLNN